MLVLHGLLSSRMSYWEPDHHLPKIWGRMPRCMSLEVTSLASVRNANTLRALSCARSRNSQGQPCVPLGVTVTEQATHCRVAWVEARCCFLYGSISVHDPEYR